MSPARRAELAEGQDPGALILGCVDARVPPEVIFDQRLGDLLTIRTAGQALSGGAAGSVEFGTNVLAIPLVVVLGHTECGPSVRPSKAVRTSVTWGSSWTRSLNAWATCAASTL